MLQKKKKKKKCTVQTGEDIKSQKNNEQNAIKRACA